MSRLFSVPASVISLAFHGLRAVRNRTTLESRPEMPERIRLVHICTVALSMRTFHTQLRFFQRHGYLVHVISSRGKFHRELNRDSIQTTSVPMTRELTPLRDLAALWQLFRRLRKLKPHIVHAHTPKGGLLGTAAAAMAGVPVRIYHIRGFRFETMSGWKRALLLTCERVACQLSTHTVCSGPSLRQLAIHHRLAKEEKISTLGRGSTNGVDARGRFSNKTIGTHTRASVRHKHHIPEDAVVISFVGRMARDKGLVELEIAWRVLRDEFPKLYLLIVGWIEVEDPLPQDVVDRLRRDPRVVLAGRQWETPPYYATSDIICLPSYREGLAGVLLEAGAMGLPAVTTTATGCPDVVVDQQTGRLVPPGDATALAAALRGYIRDPASRTLHGHAARRHIREHYCSGVIWEAIRQLYIDQCQRAGIATGFGSNGPAPVCFNDERAA